MLAGRQLAEPIKVSERESHLFGFKLTSIADDGRFIRTFLLSLIVALVCSCSDQVSSHYSTFSEAREDRLFERGWLPDILPQDTTHISVTNDLDLNTSNGQFHIPQGALSRFKEKLQRQSETIYIYRERDSKAVWIFNVHSSGQVEYQLEIKGDRGNII